MEPTSSGSPPTIPPSLAGGTGFPTTSTMSGEDYMDRTIVMKVPGTGMTVFNRYKLQRVLGRGGMGVVWLADDLKLERPVALKFLPSLIGLDPAAVKELKTETRRGLELSHPNIVRIYDFVDDDDAAAISMEFVDGKTLSELRLGVEGGVFTTAEVSRWLLGVCDALDYAHFQRKVVHRDLKPANIMLTVRDEVAKVADFGIARSLSDTMSRLSAANMGASGTLPYMSPQQAMGERPLPTDDVYSLGATLYELFSGKPPFYRGDLPMQINSKIPPSVAERRAELDIKGREELPQEWEQAIAACLSKDPNMRPSCAGVLAEMLGLKASTGTSRAVSFGSTQRSTVPLPAEAPKKDRSPLPWLAAAAGAVLLAGGAAYYFGTLPDPSGAEGALATSTPAEAPTAAASTASVGAEPAKVPTDTEVKPATPDSAAKSDDAPMVAATASTTSPAEPAAAKPAEPAAAVPAPATGAAAATTEMSAASATAQAAPAAPAAADAPAPSGGTMVAALAPAPASPALTPPDSPPAATPAGAPPGPGSAMALEPASSQVPASVLSMPPKPAYFELPLPDGYVPPPNLREQIFSQPNYVPDPPGGFWPHESIFPTAPFNEYSDLGRRHLLFKVQEILKGKKLFDDQPDGQGSEETHIAIERFQGKNDLKVNGLLDVPTLAAMSLSTEPDNKEWKPPIVAKPVSAPAKKPVGAVATPAMPRSIGPRPSATSRVPVGGRYAPQIKEPNAAERILNGISNPKNRD